MMIEREYEMTKQLKSTKFVPEVTTNLRKDFIKVPEVIRNASGIKIMGKRIKSLIFTTDISIILNNNADAVLAVYPFTPHPAIVNAISTTSNIPVLAGVGGGLTQGPRSKDMALFAESHNCTAVVLNAPTPIETIRLIDEVVDIPIVKTIVSEFTDIQNNLDAGVDIVNVSCANDTPDVVRSIRKKFPKLPIIATGGPKKEHIIKTIEAGANAITYTPPSNGVLFSNKMDVYREKVEDAYIKKHGRR